MIRFRGVVLAIAAAALAVAGDGGAAAQTLGYSLDVAGDTATFSGRIGGDGAAALQRVLSSAERLVRRLVITSRGGDLRDALPVAETIRDRRIAVTAREVCLTSCLGTILAASPDRAVEADTVIGFVGSPIAIGLYFEAAGNPRFATLARSIAERERSFLRSVGVRPELPLIVAAMMDPMCIQEREERPVDDFERYGLGFGRTIFVPSRRQLDALGIRDVRGWRPTRTGIAATLRALGIGEGYGPSFDPDRRLLVEPAKIAPRPLPRCFFG